MRSPARLLEQVGMADYRLGLTMIACKTMTTHKNIIKRDYTINKLLHVYRDD